MSKAVSKNSCWLDRSGEYATHGSRRGISLLGWEEKEWMSPEQERAALVAYIKRLDAVLASGELLARQRSSVGLAKRVAEERVHSIRPKLRRVFVGLDNFIIEVLKERLPKFQYESAVAEARRRFALDQNARNK